MSEIIVSKFDEDDSKILAQLEEIYQVLVFICLIVWRHYSFFFLNLFSLFLAITETG